MVTENWWGGTGPVSTIHFAGLNWLRYFESGRALHTVEYGRDPTPRPEILHRQHRVRNEPRIPVVEFDGAPARATPAFGTDCQIIFAEWLVKPPSSLSLRSTTSAFLSK